MIFCHGQGLTPRGLISPDEGVSQQPRQSTQDDPADSGFSQLSIHLHRAALEWSPARGIDRNPSSCDRSI